MQIPAQKQRSVQLHDFSMTPASDVPRSQFNLSHGRKVPFSFSRLIPILCEFAIPGDTWNCRISVAARTAVPIVPVQDNWHLHYFSFFVPMRLVWANSQKFFGEQDNPGDSIAYVIPKLVLTAGGTPVSSIYDYFDIPGVGQVAGGQSLVVNSLPLRCYNRIWNTWFRDENLQTAVPMRTTDGGDLVTDFTLLSRGKRFDYITQALPWPQKGGVAVSIPLGTTAPVKTSTTDTVTGTQQALSMSLVSGGKPGTSELLQAVATSGNVHLDTGAPSGQGLGLYPANLYADLAGATAATINALRTSITLQQYLEKDARGGTRYNEFVWAHYKVRTADARLSRPEFIGGGKANIRTVPIPQTSATGLTGGTAPIGTLAATGYVEGSDAGFTYSATEHGYILTLVCATADLTYSQGLRRMWSISTRYDIPVPLLANIGEQTLYNQEVFADGTGNDTGAFGYVPRFDEYRFIPSTIVGIYRPTAAGNIAYWHSSQLFASLPTLNSTFITDDAATVTQRNFSAGAASANQQILADFYFDIKAARPLPLYGIPGLSRL